MSPLSKDEQAFKEYLDRINELRRVILKKGVRRAGRVDHNEMTIAMLSIITQGLSDVMDKESMRVYLKATIDDLLDRGRLVRERDIN